jgi:acyl-CoA synthetase (AMP-forming)/AMP-acid ligase II
MSAYFEAPRHACSLVEIAQLRAAQTPDELAFRFLVDGEREGPSYTYAELNRKARAIAAAVASICRPGDRALLLYEPGLEFIPALLGCFYAGIVPVPAYPPRLDRLAQGWMSLHRLAADCSPTIGLSTADLIPVLARGMPAGDSCAPLHWLASDQVDLNQAQAWQQQPISPQAVAFLQYTSGSTSVPRGVIVTHANLLHNERMWEAAAEHRGPGLGVCWLPLHHDMGLIGGVLQGIYHGSPIVLMSPLAMLQRPARWLEAISRYRADTSGGPNFAYDLCVTRIGEEEKKALDLSNWSVACIGAEPISPGTIARFSEAFAGCGFRPEAFYPSYGLAEATLFVAGGSKGQRPVVRTFEAASLEAGKPQPTAETGHQDRTLVGCGHAWMDQTLLIVDPQTRQRVPAGHAGEIWVSGPSVAHGYWNRPEETALTFGASVAGEPEIGYLRTGDLGFIFDGELFITGRLKEVLIIRGRNYYPQDIEATIQSSNPVFRRGGGAIFEVGSGDSLKLVVAQELDRKLSRQADQKALTGDIRLVVAESHALQLHDVVFLEPGTLPRTTSGKIQRFRCRQAYEANTFKRWKSK